MSIPTLLTLQEAAARLGKVTARALRTEARKGRLHLTRVAGKDYVTESDLGEMIERCRAAQRGPGCGSTAGQGGSPLGSSSMPDAKLAQDAAKATALALRERLAGTSPTNTTRRREKARSTVSSSPT